MEWNRRCGRDFRSMPAIRIAPLDFEHVVRQNFTEAEILRRTFGHGSLRSRDNEP